MKSNFFDDLVLMLSWLLFHTAAKLESSRTVSIDFLNQNGPLNTVCHPVCLVRNGKFRRLFGRKAKMLFKFWKYFYLPGYLEKNTVKCVTDIHGSKKYSSHSGNSTYYNWRFFCVSNTFSKSKFVVSCEFSSAVAELSWEVGTERIFTTNIEAF